MHTSPISHYSPPLWGSWRGAILLCLLHLLAVIAMQAQPLCQVTRYNEDNGVASSHITQLLQDKQGFMWFSTWNGLCRYDGYEFRTFKPQVGDGCKMMTDRIRNIELLSEELILCQLDEQQFIFDLRDYRFRDLSDSEQKKANELMKGHRMSRSLKRKPYTWTDRYNTQWTLDDSGKLTYLDTLNGSQQVYPLQLSFRNLTFVMPDHQGNLWALGNSSLYRFTTDKQRTRRLPITPQAEVKALFADSKNRYWVATKDDKAVRVFSAVDNHLIGYLGADGHIHPSYTKFGFAVYCMYETPDGTLWLGTKPDGLFRMKETSTNTYQIAHFTDIPNQSIYHITSDREGRLWLATLGGGICYTNTPNAEHPHFLTPRQYPLEAAQRARYIHLTTIPAGSPARTSSRQGASRQGAGSPAPVPAGSPAGHNQIMLIATSGGLLVSKLEPKADAMRFTLHQREPSRASSLSSSATMDIAENASGQLFVSTESGGVNKILDTDLTKQQLNFQHINVSSHELPSDMVQSMIANADGQLIVVGSHVVSLLDTTNHARVFDAHYFHADYRFSEAQPLFLPPLSRGDDFYATNNQKKAQLLFALTDGAFITIVENKEWHSYSPKVVLTHVSIQGGNDNWAAEHTDTLTLMPDERSLTVHFAAIDYNAPERISYAFRLIPEDRNDSTEWNYIGHDRSATLLDLAPGTYILEIRSTNSDGEWQDNQRTLTVIVKPAFWESTTGRLLIVLLIVATLAAIIYTLLYIRHIKRQQHETLEKYLALIEVREKNDEATPKQTDDSQQTSYINLEADDLDPMLKRVMEFVEENIANSDVGVGDMALAAATSRSGLQRKLKQTLGVTPQELMHEARIKRACHMLRATDKNVSEIAYACGFSDPKYFSRSFRQAVGQTPTEYRGMRDER